MYEETEIKGVRAYWGEDVDVVVRGGTSDLEIATSIFSDDGGASRFAEVSDGDWVMDCGAHAGYFGLLMAMRFCAYVIAVEPLRGNAYRIVDNFCLHGLLDRVILEEAALGRYSYPAQKIYYNSISSHDRFIGSSSDSGDLSDFVTVPVYCLKDIMCIHRVPRLAFVKIDIEGAEYGVFGSLEKETLSNIRDISVEFHDVPLNNGFPEPGWYDKLGINLEGFNITVLPQAGSRVLLHNINFGRV